MALRTNRETHSNAWIGTFICGSYSNITCTFLCHQLKFKASVINENTYQSMTWRKTPFNRLTFQKKKKKLSEIMEKSSLNWKSKKKTQRIQNNSKRTALLKWLFEFAAWYHVFTMKMCYCRRHNCNFHFFDVCLFFFVCSMNDSLIVGNVHFNHLKNANAPQFNYFFIIGA